MMDSPLAEVAGILGDVAGTSPATGAYRYYGSDHLGSTRGLYDGSKSALGSYEYTPYGEVYASSGTVSLDGLAAAFTGKPWDAAAQMYYFPYRWYSPSAAHWLTRDPLGMVDGPNVYGYVRMSPARKIDTLERSLHTPRTFRETYIDYCRYTWPRQSSMTSQRSRTPSLVSAE